FLREHRGLIRSPKDITSDIVEAEGEREAKVAARDRLTQNSTDLEKEQFKTLGLTDEQAKDKAAIKARFEELQQSTNPENRARAEKVQQLQDQIDRNSDKARKLDGEIKETERELRKLSREEKFAENLAALPPEKKTEIIKQFDRILREGDKS